MVSYSFCFLKGEKWLKNSVIFVGKKLRTGQKSASLNLRKEYILGTKAGGKGWRYIQNAGQIYAKRLESVPPWKTKVGKYKWYFHAIGSLLFRTCVMNVKGIFGSRLIEEQMYGNMIGILLRISVSNAYLSSCLRKRFRRSETWSPILFVFEFERRNRICTQTII